MKLSTILKNKRIEMNLKIKDLASQIGIDSSLISRYENGDRLPTKSHLLQLIEHLSLDYQDIHVLWLKAKIFEAVGYDSYLVEAINLVKEEMASYGNFKREELPNMHKEKLNQIDELHSALNEFRTLDSFRVQEVLQLEYTYESNKIEGNTLTLQETNLVINEGMTISGKTMREHLEAINHKDAIDFVKDLAKPNYKLKERDLLQLHQLILRGIHPEDAGKYRKVQVMINGSTHMPPAPYLVQKQMEDLFIWYNQNYKTLHPVVLAAEMHERLVTIHPFIDGNGRTSRLLMNLILMQHGYAIANLKGDVESRMMYYRALEKCQTTSDKTEFIQLIIDTEKSCLERYLKILRGY